MIIKKFNKENYSDTKSYRVISLLNCLDKISERIIAERLSYFAETTDLLHFDQIGNRKQKSAIDAAISLLSDIEINKHDKKLTSVLFLDIKSAYDHLNKSQMIKICQNAKLSSACINWIHSFLTNRRVQLAFDDEIMNKSASIHVGTSQGSSVSSILWLIYINQLYKSNNHLNVRISSYSDDIAIIAVSKSIKENCNKLQNAAKSLVEWGNSHNVQFDVKKTELIHFDSSKKSMKYSVKFMKNNILPQELVRYLGVWFDRKLSFKAHVQERIAAANRMFHSISRLANTERDLSFQAFRKLYIACITSVADYGVPVWWKNQQFLLDKFEKLQNSALRKILEAFRTSPIAAMEIEAGIASVSVRFEKLCKNYALRILQMQNSHPVKQRVSFNSPFSSENNGINLAKIDNYQLANWNQDISYSESETEPEFHSQRTRKTRRKKKKKKKKKKYTSQIFKICSHLKEQFDSISSSSSSDCEQFDSNWTFPWQKSAIKTE